MNKKFLLILVLSLFVGNMFASSVDVNTAKKIGLNYAKANIPSERDLSDLTLAYVFSDANETPSVYVFNTKGGFILVSADDCARPILGYSEDGNFNIDAIPAGLRDFIDIYVAQISFASANGITASEEIKQEWNDILKKGVIKKYNKSSVEPFLTVHWNQDWPFNKFCPVDQWGPGGHVYAGCAAVSMAAIMKYWNYPATGTGTHSYVDDKYGTQTVNYGEATYNWDNMPAYLYSGSPTNQVDEVAKLMYHCGVALDMDYDYNGSGTSSFYMPDAVKNYYSYASITEYRDRDLYSTSEWKKMLKETLDENFPIAYSGSEANGSGGHSFICCGYNENDFFYFDFGWSGMSNGYFSIDALTVTGYHFSYNQTGVFDFIPKPVYEALTPTITTLSIVPFNAYSLKANVSWENPATSVSGNLLTSIDKVVVLREGSVVFSSEDVVPGETMSFVDEVEDFGIYEYSIYFYTNNVRGRTTTTTAIYGPSCNWKVTATTTNFQGWNNGVLEMVNSEDVVIASVTMTSSTPISKNVRVPEGNIRLKWTAPTTAVQSLSIIVKNSNNEVVYNYTGASSGLTAGVVYTNDNDCHGCEAPTDLNGTGFASDNAFGAMITWDIDYNPASVKIYRADNPSGPYTEIATANPGDKQYFDEIGVGSYSYKVSAYNTYCESDFAMTSDMSADYVTIAVTDVDENDAQAVRIYPNPAKSVLNIEATGLQEIVIYNALGQKIGAFAAEGDKLTVGIDDFVGGIYFIHLVSDNGTSVKTVSITR